MASADELYLTVKGRGGHGALPHDTVDSIVLTAQIITALQTLVSREADPILPSVLTFGHIASTGGATNIIPNEVKLKGTFRTMDERWRAHALKRIQEVADGIAKAMGGSAQLDIIHGYPFLHNNEPLTARATTGAREYMGEENVVVDIGRATDTLKAALKPLAYANLDEALPGKLTTTEFLCKYVWDVLADAARKGDLGPGSEDLSLIRVTLNESHIAKAWYEAAP